MYILESSSSRRAVWPVTVIRIQLCTQSYEFSHDYIVFCGGWRYGTGVCKICSKSLEFFCIIVLDKLGERFPSGTQ